MHKRLMLILTILLIFCSASFAEWTFQIGTGSAYSFKSPLLIEQDGEEDIHVNAEYETKALATQAWYYDMRLGYWEDGHAWEIETLHHKLYLKNKPDDVQHFAISHGYNLNTLNYAFLWKGVILRAGLGFVMTHPETTIRNKENEDDGGFNGFYLSGVTSQIAIEKRYNLPFYEKVFISVEGKLTASYAKIPVADGHATVPNQALHGILSIGYRFGE